MNLSISDYLPPSQTVKPICPYFGVCGGCDSQDIAYADQLAAKSNWLTAVFKDLKPDQIHPIIGSGEAYPIFFRNKIRFNFQWEAGQVVPTRHQKGNDNADITAWECYLQSPEANQVIQFIAKFATSAKWRLYDTKTQAGWLKHVLIRQAKSSREVMLVVISDESPIPALPQFIQAVQTELPFVTSLYHSTTFGSSTEQLTDQLLWGQPRISEQVGDWRFWISPQAFFQTNGAMLETFYNRIAELAGSGQQLWDLYAGSATIGSYLSRQFEQVLCIESNPANLEDAQLNLETNQIQNLELVAGKVEDILTSSFISTNPVPDVIVLDPPRAGLHPRLRQLVPQLKAKQIVYASCNPLTCLRDCRELLQNGYRLASIQPIDMFPHSWHCEMIAVLVKK